MHGFRPLTARRRGGPTLWVQGSSTCRLRKPRRVELSARPCARSAHISGRRFWIWRVLRRCAVFHVFAPQVSCARFFALRANGRAGSSTLRLRRGSPCAFAARRKSSAPAFSRSRANGSAERALTFLLGLRLLFLRLRLCAALRALCASHRTFIFPECVVSRTETTNLLERVAFQIN